MITGFLFDLLPVWLARLAALARESALYQLFAALYRRLRMLAQGSLLAQVWRGFPALARKIRRSAAVRLINNFTALLTVLAGKSGSRLLPQIQCSRTFFALCKLPGLNLGWLYGFGFLILFLCPGELWRNQYGLLLSLLLFAVTLLVSFQEHRLPFRANDLGMGLVIFILACLLGIFGSQSTAEGLRVFCFFATAFLLCLSILGGLTNWNRLRTFLGFLYFTLLLTGLIAVIQRIRGVEVSASLTDLTVNAGMPGRVYSTLENPNNFAEFIVLFFPLSMVYCLRIQDRRWKTLAFAGLLIPVVALLMTYSRSGWVSFSLAAVVFMALWDKRLLPLLPVAAVILLPLLPQSVFNRILTIGSTADSSNVYRVYIWKSALEMLGVYGITGLGLGPGNFTPVYASFCSSAASAAQHAHMLFLEVWLEMGILGIVSFLAFYLVTIRRAIRAQKKASPRLRPILIACASSLVGIGFSCTVEYVWYYPRILFAFFLLAGITLAALRLSRKEK